MGMRARVFPLAFLSHIYTAQKLYPPHFSHSKFKSQFKERFFILVSSSQPLLSSLWFFSSFFLFRVCSLLGLLNFILSTYSLPFPSQMSRFLSSARLISNPTSSVHQVLQTRRVAHERQEGEVVIPMIAFIEDGIRIPMGRVTRDYLIAHRLSPTQCTPNMFRILGSVDALNEKMGLNLTHHDINWIDNRHYLTGQVYYLKTMYLKVRLISCLPESNKGMNKDYLIVFEEQHDGHHSPTKEGTPSEAPKSRFFVLIIIPFFSLMSPVLPFFFFFYL